MLPQRLRRFCRLNRFEPRSFVPALHSRRAGGRSSGVQEFRSSGVQELGSSGVQELGRQLSPRRRHSNGQRPIHALPRNEEFEPTSCSSATIYVSCTPVLLNSYTTFAVAAVARDLAKAPGEPSESRSRRLLRNSKSRILPGRRRWT